MADPACVQAQFGRNLRRIRSLAGLSQAELGRRLGISFQQIQKYESGANGVSVANLCRLKTSLGCEFADLLAGLGGLPAAEARAAAASGQRVADRLTRAVLAIEGREQHEWPIRLARAMARRP